MGTFANNGNEQKIQMRQSDSILVGEDWHVVGDVGEPAFENGWVNYGGGWTTAAFFKDAYGIVHLKGLVKNGTADTVIFTLPVGYRPSETMHLPTVSNETANDSTLNIVPDGTVKQRTGGQSYFSLDHITFRAEQ